MGEFEPETDPVVRRARDRLRTCRQAAALVLAEVLRTAKGKPQVFAARELALLAPRDAIPTIVALLDAADADMRRGLRRALAAAAGSPRAKGAVEAELSGDRFSKRPLRTQIDLLRSLGDGLAGFAGAGAALNRTATSDTTFRSRYLLLGPAACLAAARDPAATAWLKRAIEQDESHHIRAEAARRAGGVAALAPSLSHALQDSQPRVRQGALEALAETGKHADGRAEARAVKLLQGDPWTFVRVEAAHALGGRPRNEAGDRALMNAMEDESPHVRRALLRALGQRKSHIAAQLIHDVANNAKEKQSVRIAAIVALGELCRKDAAPLLYKLALRAGFAQLPYDQPLGLAALAALGDIKPPGLAKQLAPLLGNDKRVPRLVRLIARDVVTREGNCSAKKKPAKR
jgi:HEAT repeat protein